MELIGIGTNAVLCLDDVVTFNTANATIRTNIMVADFVMVMVVLVLAVLVLVLVLFVVCYSMRAGCLSVRHF